MAIAGVSVVCFNQLGPQLAIAKELGLVKVIVCICKSFGEPRTTNAQKSLFSLKSQTFGLGQINWTDKFWAFGVFSADL